MTFVYFSVGTWLTTKCLWHDSVWLLALWYIKIQLLYDR